jgi:hypothetical protein
LLEVPDELASAILALMVLFAVVNVTVFRELSRDPKSSEQFVELNRCHRDIETQLARSSASLSMIPIGSQVASI